MQFKTAAPLQIFVSEQQPIASVEKHGKLSRLKICRFKRLAGSSPARGTILEHIKLNGKRDGVAVMPSDGFDSQICSSMEKIMRTEIKDLPNLFMALKAMLGSDQLVERWWDTPNRAFNMLSASEAFEQDKTQVVRYVLSYLQR